MGMRAYARVFVFFYFILFFSCTLGNSRKRKKHTRQRETCKAHCYSSGSPFQESPAACIPWIKRIKRLVYAPVLSLYAYGKLNIEKKNPGVRRIPSLSFVWEFCNVPAYTWAQMRGRWMLGKGRSWFFVSFVRRKTVEKLRCNDGRFFFFFFFLWRGVCMDAWK